MSEGKGLRAVEKHPRARFRPGKPVRHESLKAAADAGERDLLVSMRDTISDRIGEGVPAHTLAPLMRQLRAIDQDIRALDVRLEHEAVAAAEESQRGDVPWDQAVI